MKSILALALAVGFAVSKQHNHKFFSNHVRTTVPEINFPKNNELNYTIYVYNHTSGHMRQTKDNAYIWNDYDGNRRVIDVQYEDWSTGSYGGAKTAQTYFNFVNGTQHQRFEYNPASCQKQTIPEVMPDVTNSTDALFANLSSAYLGISKLDWSEHEYYTFELNSEKYYFCTQSKDLKFMTGFYRHKTNDTTEVKVIEGGIIERNFNDWDFYRFACPSSVRSSHHHHHSHY